MGPRGDVVGLTGVGLLAIRLALGVVFTAHGLHKLFGFFDVPGLGPGGIDPTAAYFEAIGLTPGLPLAVLAGVTQLLTGVLLIVGYVTRWASAALGMYALIGVWAEHWRWGFFLNWIMTPGQGHGIEYSVVILGALVALTLSGGGEFSLDAWRARTAESRSSARDRVRRKF